MAKYQVPIDADMSTSDFVSSIRARVPILETKVYGHPLIYLDNAATTQKPHAVLEAMETYYRSANANVHRSIHYLAAQSTEQLESSRDYIQQHLSARSRKEIIFTKGTTEAINLVASSWGAELEEGDEILVSAMEHHSNLVPWQLLADRKRLRLRQIPLSSTGETLDHAAYEQMLNPRTKLVVVVHVSNALGRINAVSEIIQKAHQQGARVLVDGAQAIAHLPIDLQALDVDFYAFSAHKAYGPMGIGVLYAKEELLEKMPPYQGGGEMIQSVTFEHSTFNDLPYKFEAGTPNVAGVIGLRAALEWIQAIGYPQLQAHEEAILNYCSEELRRIPGLRLFAAEGPKAPICSFTIEGVHDFDIGQLLDARGIALRTGHHCTQPLLHELGVETTIRASMACYTNEEELSYFVTSLRSLLNRLR